MSIDYSAAGKWAKHVRALAIIESDELARMWGDNDKAVGLLQMHPGRFLEEGSAHGEFAITPEDDWTTAQIKSAARYFENHSHYDTDLVVQAWRLGKVAVWAEGQRDQDYFNRWVTAFEGVEVDGVGNESAAGADRERRSGEG